MVASAMVAATAAATAVEVVRATVECTPAGMQVRRCAVRTRAGHALLPQRAAPNAVDTLVTPTRVISQGARRPAATPSPRGLGRRQLARQAHSHRAAYRRAWRWR